MSNLRHAPDDPTDVFASVEEAAGLTRWVVSAAGAIVGHRRTVTRHVWAKAVERKAGYRTVRCSLEDALTQHVWQNRSDRDSFANAFEKAVAGGLNACANQGANDEDRRLRDVIRTQPDTARPSALCGKCGSPAHAGRCRL